VTQTQGQHRTRSPLLTGSGTPAELPHFIAAYRARWARGRPQEMGPASLQQRAGHEGGRSNWGPSADGTSR
jgi:hypothetical protein